MEEGVITFRTIDILQLHKGETTIVELLVRMVSREQGTNRLLTMRCDGLEVELKAMLSEPNQRGDR